MFCVFILAASCIDFVLSPVFKCILLKMCAISMLSKCCVSNTEEGGFDQYLSISLLKVHEYLLAKDLGGTRIISAFYQKQLTKTATKRKRKSWDVLKEERRTFHSQSTNSSNLKSY